MDKNNNNLYASFYNSASKSREKEKASFATMLKLRENQSNLGRESQRESPLRSHSKYTISQRERLNDQRNAIFDIGTKSYRRDDTEMKSIDGHRQTSRQRSNIQLEHHDSLNKSGMAANVSLHKYSSDMSPEKLKSKGSFNLADAYASNIEPIVKRPYKVVDVDQDIRVQPASHYNSRNTPLRQCDSSGRASDFVPVDLSKGYKSAYRPQLDAESHIQHISGEIRSTSTSRKHHRRGVSIDQVVHYLGERPQSSRREKERKPSREDSHALAQSNYEKRSTPHKHDSSNYQSHYQYQQQHQQLQLQLQMQLQQQQQQQQQIQQQQLHQGQEIIVINNEQEQMKYFEKLLNIDKVTFDFEKQMIMRRLKKQNSQNTPVSSTAATKNSMHTRTRSMEDPSVLHTKSSSRWNTRKSGIDDPQNMGNDTTEVAAMEKAY